MLTPWVSQWWRMVRVATFATRYQTNRWLWLIVRLYASGLSQADASPAAANRSTSAWVSVVYRRRLPGRVRKRSGGGASGPAADIAARLHGPLRAAHPNGMRPRSDPGSETGDSEVSLMRSRALSTLSQTFHSSTPRTCPAFR